MSIRNHLAEDAYRTIDRFVRRFGPAYRLLARYAAIPLILTPELLGFLRSRFLLGQLPWVAEADLLLSELCFEVGNEQYAMDPAVRALLLAEMRQDESTRASLLDTARLLLQYVRLLAETNGARAAELRAQQWSALAYFDDQKENLAQEIAGSLSHGLAAPEGLGARNELASLVQITDSLGPQLSGYPELLEYARELGEMLCHPANIAKSTGTARVIAGVELPALERVFSRPEAAPAPLAPSTARVLASLGLDFAPDSISAATALAARVLDAPDDFRTALRNHLRVIQANASANVTQLLLVRDSQLVIAEDLRDPEEGIRYEVASYDGIIGRAAMTRQPIWVPDVNRDKGYIRNVPRTAAEFAIPLLSRHERSLLGVVNIELPTTDSLSQQQRKWLVNFCRPLADRIPQPTNVFISYPLQDLPRAQSLSESLREAGFVPWVASDQLKPELRKDADASIEHAMGNSEWLLFMLTSRAISSHGMSVEISIALRLQSSHRIVVALMEDCQIPSRLRPFPQIDFRSNYSTGLQALLQLLRPSETQNALRRKYHPADDFENRGTLWPCHFTVATNYVTAGRHRWSKWADLLVRLHPRLSKGNVYLLPSKIAPELFRSPGSLLNNDEVLKRKQAITQQFALSHSGEELSGLWFLKKMADGSEHGHVYCDAYDAFLNEIPTDKPKRIVGEFLAPTPRDRPQVLVVGTGRYRLPERLVWVSEAIGTALASSDYRLIGGGWQGVDWLVADKFCRQYRKKGEDPQSLLTHVLEPGMEPDYRSAGIRHEVSAADTSGSEAVKMADALIVVGGLGGSYQAFLWARQKPIPVFPIAGTRGDAKKAFDELAKSGGIDKDDLLGEPIRSRKDAKRIVNAVMQRLGAQVPRPGSDYASHLPLPGPVQTPNAGSTLPNSVSLIEQMPPVRDQGERATAVAFACVAALEQYHVRLGKPVDLSEQFLYWSAKENDGQPNSPGTWLKVAMGVLQRDGCCTETTWPYISVPISGNENHGPPPSAAQVEALDYRPRQVKELAATSVFAIKSELANNRVVAVALRVFQSWYRNKWVAYTGDIVLPVPGETPMAGHAMCLVGYIDLPDSQELGGGRFLVRNSWGTRWGVVCPLGTGYGTIPYSYIERFAQEAWSIP